MHKIRARFFTILVLYFLCRLLFPVQDAFAGRYGLLVGVSSYPLLPESRRLEGPKNDIQMIADILRQRDFPSENLMILADGVPNAALPTRNAILGSLGKIRTKVKKGDFVYLHFSGHGSQQPQAASAAGQEADQLDEIFLPWDVGRWESETGGVENSISDNEIGAFITGIRAKGAFVWAVFDCCHSGTMLRGAPATEIRYRRIDPAELGVPTGIIKTSSSDNHPAEQAENDHTPGGYVAFYAAQPRELTPEMYLPQGKETARPYGLFSFSIATLLADGRPMSYRQAAQRILAQYFAQNIKNPTPMFEGSQLDAPVFGNENSRPVRQWPIVARSCAWYIPAGSLHRIGDGSIFAVIHNPADSDTEAIGYAVAGNTTTNRSELAPIAYGGKPKPERQDVPKDSYARLIVPKVNFALTVALPVLPENASKRVIAAGNAIEKASRHVPENGIFIKWVPPGEAADIRLAFTPNESKDISRNRLWFLPRNGVFTTTEGILPLSVSIDKSENELSRVLYDTLQHMGKVINLLRLANSITENNKAAALKLTLYVRRAGEQHETIILPERKPVFHEGDHVRLEACNTGSRPIDLTVLFVDSHFGISSVFPALGETNRIQAKTTQTDVIDADINTQTTGTEQLISIAVVVPRQSLPADFSFLAQPGLRQTRAADPPPCVSFHCRITDLFVQAGFHGGNLRGRSSRMHVNITMYVWRVENK